MTVALARDRIPNLAAELEADQGAGDRTDDQALDAAHDHAETTPITVPLETHEVVADGCRTFVRRMT